MSETILNTLKFTTAQCLEFEGSKNEKLQYFLVNSLRTISDLEAQLKESRIDTIAARNEVNFLKSEMSANKRKPGTKTFPSSSSSTAHQSQESGMYGGDDDEEIIIEQRPKQRRKSAPLQSPPLPSCAALASQMMPFSTRVERAIDSVATSLINPHENTPPKTFLFKFVCRIFDGGDLYYGYIVAYEKFHFQVNVSLTVFEHFMK
jgi:hypothetical protein